MRNNQLRLAVRAALAAGALATAVAAPSAFAQEAAADLDRVQVTGSRIKRTDIEGALPVTVIDREQIEVSGQISVADLLRTVTQGSFGSFRPQSGSSAQSLAEINLRGLGAERTLVLVDGRRLPKAPSTGNSNSLNTIPLAAVERIEILSDGASAIYGSDAIGGVVNIITRRDFEGVELMVGNGNPTRDGGDTSEASLVFGASGAKGRGLVGVGFNDRETVFARDREWSEVGFSRFSNNFLLRSTAGGLGSFISEVPGGCAEANFSILTSPNAVLGTQCTYNFAAVSADEASLRNVSLFANAEYDINMDNRLYVNTSVNRVKSFGRYAPVPDRLVLQTSSPNVPFTEAQLLDFWQTSEDIINAGRPPDDQLDLSPSFRGDSVFLEHRFAALGNRDSTVDENLYSGTLGWEGTFSGYDYDLGVRWDEYQMYDIGRNYLVRPIATDYINRGIYDISNPSGNPADVLNAMKATISRDALFRNEEAYGVVSTDLMDMQHGVLQGVIGAEWRRETYTDTYDSLSEAGAIGGSAGNSAGGDRIAKAAFFELAAPVLPNVEVSLAGRYDDYSDYGSDFSPKLGVRWQALDNLVVRASYGEGFRAPSMDILTQATSFSADSVRDPQSCILIGAPANCTLQIDGFRIANPDLGSESSEQWNIGLAYEPFDWLSGTIDFWNIEIDDRIAFFGAQTLVNRELAGDPIPPGLGVSRNPAGGITEILQGYGNEGTVETRGIDASIATNFNFGGAGALRNELQVTYVDKYELDGGRNLVGDPGAPEFRANLRNFYTWGDFRFGWFIQHIDSTAERVEAGQQLGKATSWTIHDVQATYFAPWNGEIFLGVRNLFDRDPVLNDFNGSVRNFDFNLYDGYGRIVYVRYKQSF